MNQQFSDSSKPMIVFSEVSQNYRPVINAEVLATLESEIGPIKTLQLLDNDAGKVFVHEWAHLRWGVYDETNDEEPFYISNHSVKATRCNKNIEGQVYEVTAGGSFQRCSMDPQTSLPTEKCKFFPYKNQNTKSSLMFLSSLDSGPRILQQRQAATHFLRNIIEVQASVAIVTFSTSAATLSPLITIDSDTTRESLIKLLPVVAHGWTNICLGLSQGLQELEKDGDVSGGELIFLTDGEATDNISGCAASAIQSGAIIHTLAFGNSADPALTEMANKTGEVQLNPPKPTVSDEPLEVGSFTRTATGESFVVTLSGPSPNFPPNRITDLSAEIQEDTVFLNWTAPGEDLDEGTDMDSRTSFVLLWMLLSSTSTGIKLDGNGYVDVVIAISSRVPQDDRLIDIIKDMVTEGSVYLYESLDKKVYFKEATILIPPHWNTTNVTKARTESFDEVLSIMPFKLAKIRIDNAQGDEPYTKQYDECGKEGQYIHFTPNYLLNDTFIQLYGLRGKVYVHEWAHLRWGVYDETNDKEPFYISNRRVEATRCSKNIKGQVYEVTAGGSPQGCRIDPQTSLPTEKCKFFPYKNQNTKSSLMFLSSLDSVLRKDGDVSGDELIFLTDGEVQLNPPKPTVSDEPLEVGSFTRTATGESFVVTLSGPPPNFPPNRITDLSAEIQEDTVFLNWTAPGEDLDEGTGKVFVHEWAHLRWGVYDETNDKEPFYISNRRVEATRCSKNIKVTSHAAQVNVPPITVKTRINQQFSNGTKPMIVFAEVSQNYRPVINAEVWAILEPESDPEQTLQLLDNGAGADAAQGDGIYSRYFTKIVSGRSSLKVKVKNKDGKTRFALQKNSGAPYVPGYVVDGEVQLNPPKPTVPDEPLEVGSFTRTATGESFVVTLSGPPPNFPPNRITDLSAEIQEDTVLLSWTAPGEDLDEGTGVVEMNPSKPLVSAESPIIGSFSRTATGESFEVILKSTTPPNFPPNRITDLNAEIQNDTVLLSWTAPGEDLDHGTGKAYY
ncbi:epithelial chloride channel -like protein [Labeo rohita]|uniref:Epithelial chloride channel-like protein n=1 Tax=Labeo rohita TaxID=84645 RepID=A0A498P4X3_LABRO|nr:epithelial chloride channel -like protein [Labeo rohita]